MSAFILIGSSVTLSLIIVHLIVKRFNLLRPLKNNNNIPVFLSNEEVLKIVTQKAKLDEDEQEQLSILFSIVSINRLHHGFEDKETTTKWLVSVRRAIANSSQFDQSAKEDMEYAAYEISRKINNVRMLSHPSIKHISDLNIGQPLTISISDQVKITGSLVDSNFYSLTVDISTSDITMVKGLKLEKKQVQISFWKIMDAQYAFTSTINGIEKKNNTLILILSNPKQINCTQIRSYPRLDTEIPIKFRQATLSADSDTGALQESFGGLLFGIINNIGPWGCSIISNISIPVHTSLMVEFPLFSHMMYIKGRIKNISHKGDLFIFNVEFAKDTPKTTTLNIYHYIFAEDSSKKTKLI
ncbi:MAG: hypothetical protein ACRC0X_05180 [Brevinema sp.]